MSPAALPSLMLSLPLLGAVLAVLLRSERSRVYSYLCSAASAVAAAIWSVQVLLEGTASLVSDAPSVWGE